MIDTDKYIEDVDEVFNLIMNLMDDEEREHAIKQRIIERNKIMVACVELDAEVKRLREGIKQIASDYGFNAIKSQSRHCPRPAYDVPAGDGIHTVTFHQKACLKIMELIE